jgi:uncharacterized protein with GYD domain
MQVNSASNRKIFVFLFCVFVNYYNAFWITVRTLTMLWITYGKFSKEGIQGLIAKPQNRAEPVRKLVEALGGKLISHHLVLNGDIDFIIFTDLPNEKLAEISHVNAMLVRGSGAIETLTTVPAISAENAVSQMKKAQQMAASMVYEKPTKS